MKQSALKYAEKNPLISHLLEYKCRAVGATHRQQQLNIFTGLTLVSFYSFFFQQYLSYLNLISSLQLCKPSFRSLNFQNEPLLQQFPFSLHEVKVYFKLQNIEFFFSSEDQRNLILRDMTPLKFNKNPFIV